MRGDRFPRAIPPTGKAGGIARDRWTTALAGLLVLAVLLAGCGAQTTAAPVREEDRVRTAAALTVSAMGTRIASGENPTLSAATYTVTPRPTQTERATRAPSPTATPQPGESGTPTAEGTANATADATAKAAASATNDAPCNRASFVGDVTIPDDSILTANSPFTKTWEIRNTGSCAWDAGYAVVFAGRGSSMGGPSAAPLEEGTRVAPGETARVSVDLRAPAEEGSYEGYWMLRSADGETFGTGENRGAPFFVKIRVAESYNFAEHWCSARWESGAGEIPCPVAETPETGARMEQLSDPRLEDNTERDGLGLLVVPQPVPGGYIAAHFPAVTVPPEADFRATISCQPGAEGCYVRFRVAYRVGGGEEQTLGEWNEGNEGGITEAIRDLNHLAGQAASFSLYVYVNGTPNQSSAIWFAPRITR